MRHCLPLVWAGVICIAIHPMLWAQEGKAKQEQAIAEIEKLGGKVEVAIKGTDKSVIGVNLKNTRFMDASLEHLKGLSKLERLYLGETRFTDDGMLYIRGLTNIELLELRRTKVTDKSLEHLRGFARLRTLDLAGTEVTDKGLEQLKALKQLETLDLSDTKVTATGIDDLKKAMPKLKIVR